MEKAHKSGRKNDSEVNYATVLISFLLSYSKKRRTLYEVFIGHFILVKNSKGHVRYRGIKDRAAC